MTFKQYVLLKEDPDAANFRIGTTNYYTTFNDQRNPISFNIIGQDFLMYSPTSKNYHNNISEAIVERLFHPMRYLNSKLPDRPPHNADEYKNRDRIDAIKKYIEKHNTLEDVKNDLAEYSSIRCIGKFDESTVEKIKSVYCVDNGGYVLRPTVHKNSEFILGRMWSLPVKQLFGAPNDENIPAFALWNNIKQLTPKIASMMLKLPPLFEMDPNKSIVEDPGVESKMLRYFLK